MTIIGPLWHPGYLEDRTLAALKTWLPVYLNEVSRNETIYENISSIAADNPDADDAELIEILDELIESGEIKPRNVAAPQSFATVSEYDRFPEQGLPAIIVSAPGMAEEPRVSGDGFIGGDWIIEVSATVSANGAKQTRRLAQMYLAAIQGAMLQRRSLGDPEMIVRLSAVEYADVSNDQRRSIVAAGAAFTVSVDRMISIHAGPITPEPPEPIPASWPIATTINIQIEES
jgi:hypothetical protein